MEHLQEFWKEFYDILLEMSPYLMLGFLVAGILHVVFPQGIIRTYTGGNNIRSVVNASLLGVPLPLCSCGVIPAGISLYRHGASKPATLSFITSTPQTGVDSILVTYSLLGLPFAIIRPFIGFVSGLISGITGLFQKDTAFRQETAGTDKPLPAGFLPRLKEMVDYAFVRFLQDIGNWLIIGLLMAALISVLVPDDFFTETFQNDYLEMLLVLIASIPVYICATGSVPIAAVLMMKGLSPGAALVLLMAGPATNAATITLIGRILGKKSLFAYLLSLTGSALFFGILLNLFAPASWFPLQSEHSMHQHEILPYWLKLASAILLSILLIHALLRKHIPLFIKKKTTTNKPNLTMQIHTLNVKGMTCSHCRASVEGAITAIAGVEKVDIELSSGKVSVEGKNLRPKEIRKAVEGVGYQVLPENQDSSEK